MVNPIVVARNTIHKQDGVNVHTVRHLYWCPGCDALHAITIRPGKQTNGASWAFTGTLECPTYEPSQLSTWYFDQPDGTRKNYCCHTFIRGGMIQFLDDCTHDKKNQTLPLPPLPDWVLRDQERAEALEKPDE